MGEQPIPRGAHVAVYLRCSTIEQINSVADQEKNIMAVVHEYGLVVAGTYRDEGISGATITDRPSLGQMLARGSRKEFSYVLAYDPSRVSRGGLADFWSLVKQFRTHKVKIFDCAKRRIVSEKDGLQYSIEASQARENNIQHSRDIIRSNYECVATRKSDPGRVPPYGFDRLRLDVNGRPVEQIRYNDDATKSILDPETKAVRLTIPKSEEYRKTKSNRVVLIPSTPERVETLQRIFKLARSTGYSGIADILNREGIPGPRGGKWTSSSIRSILKNEVYKGTVLFNVTHKGRYHQIRNGMPVALEDNEDGEIIQGDNPEEHWFIENDRHESLVDEKGWDGTQAAMNTRGKSRIKSGRSPNRCYPLSGILVCGECKSPMQGMCPDGRYRRYICSTRRRLGKSHCVPCSVSAAKVEEFKVREYLLTDCTKFSLKRGLEDIYDGLNNSMVDIEGVRKALDEIQGKKDAMFKKLTPATIEMLQDQLAAMAEEERQLKCRLATATNKHNGAFDKASFIEQCLELYEHHILQLKGGCEDAIRESLRALGTEIIYDPHKKEGGITVYPFGRSANG